MKPINREMVALVTRTVFASGVSMAELSRRMGKNSSYVCHMLNKRQPLDLVTATAIIEATGKRLVLTTADLIPETELIANAYEQYQDIAGVDD